MQRAGQAVGQDPGQQKPWGMAQTCMIHGDKTCGAPVLGMRGWGPKGLAVPLPALGVWKEEVYALSWAKI